MSQRVVQSVCVTFRLCFPWHLMLKNGVFTWHLYNGGYTWDRVQGFVSKSIHIFRNMTHLKIKRVLNQEIPRVPHFVTCLSVPLLPFKTGCIMSLCVWKRDTKRIMMTEGKRERMRERECVREKEGGRENTREKESAYVYISSSLMFMSEPLSLLQHGHNILRRRHFFFDEMSK